MPQDWQCDLGEFYQEGERLRSGVTGSTRKLARFFLAVAQAAAENPSRKPRLSGLECRRQSCPGEIIVHLTDDLDEVSWICRECHERGHLSGWKTILKKERSQAAKKLSFADAQGQYLAFIHLYTKIHREPPAETDLQRYFQVSAPSVHQMVVTLDRKGLISRIPFQPRTIRVLLDEADIPSLR